MEEQASEKNFLNFPFYVLCYSLPSFPFNLFHRIMKIDLRSLTMLIMFMATLWFILNDVHSTPFDFHSHFHQFIRSWISNRRKRMKENKIHFGPSSQTQNVNESKWLLLRIDKYLLKIYHFFPLTVYRTHYLLYVHEMG